MIKTAAAAILFSLPVVLLGHCPSAAEQIILKNGQTFEGKVVSYDGEIARIERFGVVIPYFVSEIQSPALTGDGPAASELYAQWGFSIKWPAGWSFQEMEMGPPLLFYAYVGDPDKIKEDSPRIYVMGWRDNSPLETMGAKVIDDLFKRSSSSGSTPVISSPLKSVTVNGFPAVTFSFDFQDLYDEWEKVWMRGVRVDSYLFNSGGIMILLDIVYHNDRRSAQELAVYGEMLKSLRLIPPE